MPSAKHNSIMERVMVLISSLFDVTSSRDVPFWQVQQPHSKHHGPLLFQFFSLTMQGVDLQ